MTNVQRPRRYRTMTEQLGSILLAFEVIAVFLAGLTIFGLDLLPTAVALGGTAVFVIAMVLGVRFLRYPWGRWYVLGFQIALVLCGFVHSSMFFVGALFLALWVYCLVQGGKIDAERAVIIAEYERQQAAAAPATESPGESTD